MVEIPNIPGITISPIGAGKVINSGILPLLAGLPQGTQLSAQVIRHDTAGNAILNLEEGGVSRGEILVQSRIFLPDKSNLTLKILTNTLPTQTTVTPQTQTPIPQFEAQIVTINGHTPYPPSANQQQGTLPQNFGYDIIKAINLNIPQSSGIATAQTTATQTQSASIINISNGSFVDAVIINPAIDTGKLLPQPVALKTSDVVRLHIIANNIPQAGNVPPSPNQNLSQTNLNLYNQVAAETDAVSVPSNIIADRNIPNPATPVTNNPQFTGTVIGTEKSGELVIKTDIGVVKFPSGISLPNGTVLTLEAVNVTQITEENRAVAAEKIIQDSGGRLISQKEAFHQLAALLASFDAEIGSNALKRTFPTADKQAAAKILWFLGGVNSGSTQSWMPADVRRMIEQFGHRDVITKLDNAFSGIKAMAGEITPSGWSSMIFPLYDGHKLNFGIFHIKRDGGEKDKKEKNAKDNVRFLVELDMDNLGEIQLDGFVRNLSPKRELDLFLRTKNQLPDEMKSEIIDIFQSSTELSGVTGNLQFQVVNDFPVKPLEDGELKSPDSGIIA